jgi:tetratricopeptide (TPR) repeat protein
LVICGMALLLFITGCPSPHEVSPNPWLVPFGQRHSSAVSRSQMRSMVRLAQIYKNHRMEKEYIHAMTTAVELYAGDIEVTFELLNELIGKINESRADVARRESSLSRLDIDPSLLTADQIPYTGSSRREAEAYLEAKSNLEALYEETYRILSSACGQIPYNADLYYRTAHLQFLRAEDDGDRDKYRDAINFLKRAIASDSSSLESYHLIALAYERLGDTDRAIRFWRLFEVVYEIAPETMGPGFITPQRESMHREALEHLEALGASTDE